MIDEISFVCALAPLVYRQPLAEMVVSCHLLHSISGNPQLGNDEWTVLGGAGANRASTDGRSARGSHSLAGAPGVQDALT